MNACQAIVSSTTSHLDNLNALLATPWAVRDPEIRASSRLSIIMGSTHLAELYHMLGGCSPMSEFVIFQVKRDEIVANIVQTGIAPKRRPLQLLRSFENVPKMLRLKISRPHENNSRQAIKASRCAMQDVYCRNLVHLMGTGIPMEL